MTTSEEVVEKLRRKFRVGHFDVCLGDVRRYRRYLCVGLLCGNGVNGMRMIEAAKVPPLIRLLLMKHPYADDIMEQMQYLIDEHTIDAVPVVRCQYCQHWDEIKHGKGWCKGFAPSDVFSDYDDYCSHWERKEGADEDR